VAETELLNGESLAQISFQGQDQQVSWHGVCCADGDTLSSFMTTDVAARLHDQQGAADFKNELLSLATTGFARASLEAILDAAIPEERDWAVGEALAEAYLSREHAITWPWNMERDKRTPRASLPGADLVGFEVRGDLIRLALGEVKTSSDGTAPPNVMNGRSGMVHQLDNLASDLGVLHQLLNWLLHRCKGSQHESTFQAAIKLLLESGNKAVALFGVLVRDTAANVLDLEARGRALAKKLHAPTSCNLIAVYLPCAIAELPHRVAGGQS
jgi:hypothetical protein